MIPPDRLVYDPTLRAMVVRGTWITTTHIAMLDSNGSTWANIVRTHPEVTIDDVRAALKHEGRLNY